jgi:hypothetical protein
VLANPPLVTELGKRFKKMEDGDEIMHLEYEEFVMKSTPGPVRQDEAEQGLLP